MEPTHTLPPIYEQVKEYLETKHKLLKLEAIDKTSASAAEVITSLTIAAFFLIAFIVFSLTLALLAAHLLHSDWEGFCCITILYVFIALMISLFKVRLKNNLIRKFIEIIFRKGTHK